MRTIDNLREVTLRILIPACLLIGSVSLLGCPPSNPVTPPQNGSASADPTSGGTSSPTGTSNGGADVVALVASADASRGKKLFDGEHCHGCHGTKEKPPAKFPNLFKIDWSSEALAEGFETIKKGDSPMPAYGDKLDDKQVADLLAYFKSESE